MAKEQTFIQFLSEGVIRVAEGSLQGLPVPEVFGASHLVLVTGLAGRTDPAVTTSREIVFVGASAEDTVNDLVPRFGEDVWVIALDEGELEIRGRIYRRKAVRRRRDREIHGAMDTLTPALESSLLAAARVWWFGHEIAPPHRYRLGSPVVPGSGIRFKNKPQVEQFLDLTVVPVFPYSKYSAKHIQRGLIDRFLPPRSKDKDPLGQALMKEIEAHQRLLETQSSIVREIAVAYLSASSEVVFVAPPSGLEADSALDRVGPAMRQKLLDVLPERAAEVWLTSPTSMLDGEAPIDVLLHDPSRSHDVQAALEAFAAGVF